MGDLELKLSPPPRPAPNSRWTHVRTGRSYRVVNLAYGQSTDAYGIEGRWLVVYEPVRATVRAEDGQLRVRTPQPWFVREVREFLARFEPAAPPTSVRAVPPGPPEGR